jgi:RecA/RadA recombinase
MSLLEKLRKNSTIKQTEVLEDSTFFDDFDDTPTDVPIMNVALAGKIGGGLRRGITGIAGESRHFKSLFGLIMIKAYLDKHKDAVCLFYDSEFGAGKKYFDSVGIDPNRVVHTPVEDIDQLVHDIMVQLEDLKRGDKVVIFVDSIGSLGSKKEAVDAVSGNDATDMTRAKRLKSMSRLLPVRLVMRDIPMVAINHTYQEQKMYGKTIVSGGQGIMLASEVMWIITRSQEKDGTDLIGYNFKITIDKSRWVKEKSQVSVEVLFDGGINIYSGLLELALESKHITKPSNGWYQRVDPETGELIGNKMRNVDCGTPSVLGEIIKDKAFNDFVEKKFQLSHSKLLTDNGGSDESAE